ncbi:hypothetical protein FHT98_3132 [Bosea sp. AK1]|nr:hypothetical protein FHT98_3132 [Bosea sp. AK1]
MVAEGMTESQPAYMAAQPAKAGVAALPWQNSPSKLRNTRLRSFRGGRMRPDSLSATMS